MTMGLIILVVFVITLITLTLFMLFVYAWEALMDGFGAAVYSKLTTLFLLPCSRLWDRFLGTCPRAPNFGHRWKAYRDH